MKESTIIRNLRRYLKTETSAYRQACQERDIYRVRATRAETEAAEWKRRFDALLSKCEPTNVVGTLRVPPAPEEPKR